MKGHSLPDPREAFLQDFSAFVESRIEQDEELIIGMDENDTYQANSNFSKFHNKCDLVDVFAHLHPGITPPYISTQ
eukprot:13132807-Ditylum_brightwellii.AAC.1